MLKRSRKNRQRRGVLLLVVLAILAMFALLAVTYSIIAHHYRNASAVGLTLEQTEDDPRKELDRAFYDLLRDTRNQKSPLRGLSILADFYGMDGFICQLAGSASPAGATQGQFFHLPLNAGTFTDIYGRQTDNVGNPLVPSPTAGFYNGLVLTVLDGPAAGVTARVVGYIPDPAFVQPVLRVAILPEGSHRHIYNLATDLPAGTRIIVNGRPFNGTGVGYDAQSVDPDDDPTTPPPFSERLTGSGGTVSVPYALSPNLADEPESILWDAISGGSDESYDAADFQNPFLAIVPPHPDSAADIKPSFQLRALNHYWNAQNGGDVAGKNQLLYRRISFRPNHRPNQKTNKFHLNNPSFDPVMDAVDPNLPAELQPKWDVDNDSDGITDSIWMDLGYPTKTASDGRLYKPLFAVLCTDLDGRLNLNAHGHVASLPGRGQGYGPSEIDLEQLLGPNSDVLFSGANGKRGRYGNDFKPGRDGKDTAANAERFMMALEDSRTTSEVAFHDHPEDYRDRYWKHGFGSPPDLHGLMSVSVNPYGQPVYDEVKPQGTVFYPNTDSPYEMGLSTLSVRGDIASSRDTLFSTAELERVLRCYDSDAGGPPAWTSPVGRIDQLFADPDFSRRYHNQITTEGFDVPAPSLGTTDDLRRGPDPTNPKTPNDSSEALHFVANIAEIVRKRLKQHGNFTDEASISLKLEKLLSPDLLKGLRFDVNRVFGDGFDGGKGPDGEWGVANVDDDGNSLIDDKLEAGYHHDGQRNFVVDDPSESRPPDPDVDFWGEYLAGVPMDLENDGNVADGNRLARQLYARHLYVLMMALLDTGKTIDFHGPDGLEELDPDDSIATAKGLAQWAINVVDFRDSDSIMTPFEFDINPFDGWDVDGWIDTNSTDNNHPDRQVVWGCERPELLITETLAFHDRRTEDLDNDDSGEGYHLDHLEAEAPDDQDNDYDQRERPRGSLFIELYNPWTADDRSRPAEFYYDYRNGLPPQTPYDYNALRGVRLNQRTLFDENDQLINEDGQTISNSSPVWRLLIVLPEQPAEVKEPEPGSPKIKRSVYFTDQDPGIPGDGTPYWAHGVNPAQEQDMTLVPGQYAVLGSARESTNDPNPDPNVYDSELLAEQQIRLDPQNSTVAVARKDEFPLQPGHPSINTSLAIGISKAIQVLSISEPIGGYPAPVNGTEYDPPRDTPLDADIGIQPEVLMNGGTEGNFRVIHLQRLANPLIRYDSQTNPYRTIDSMYVNLTVFNSLTKTGDDPDPFKAEPSNFRNATGQNTVANRFVTLQRGDFEAPGTNTLWQAYLPTAEILQSGRGNNGIPAGAGEALQQTLGQLNQNYQVNPTQPFPWLLWLNRPFVNNLELLHVPHTSSARLTALFTWPTSRDVPWKDDSTLYQSSNSDFNDSRYRHLLNFFDSGIGDKSRSELFRVFELTHVPSRFLGTSLQLNPAVFQAGNPATEKYQAPFNQLSYFRDPGRININTIYSEKVWNAVKNGFAGPDYEQLAGSRRGYPQVGGPTTDPVVSFSSFPTLFRNPFRAFGSAQFVPRINNAQGEPGSKLMLPGGLLRGTHSEIAATLLRPKGVFADRESLLFQNSSAVPEVNDRHSYFRYQFLQRLGNLVTTRSNVYAIWITVGYFEVDPQTGEPGLERGLEGGEVNRHRAFYIVDRTIPVAFEPGKNHNVDRAVLLRRFIE